MQLDADGAVVDVAVVGAGPAGLAAAATAADLGLSVVLLDEQTQPGGQIYRDVARAGVDRMQVLGNDYADSFAKAQDDSEGIMNGGTDVRPHHYVTMWEALGQVSGTAAAPVPPFSRTDWKISGM